MGVGGRTGANHAAVTVGTMASPLQKLSPRGALSRQGMTGPDIMVLATVVLTDHRGYRELVGG